MSHPTPAAKSPNGQKHETARAPSAGPRGSALLPPRYGIEFVDGAADGEGPLQLMPGPDRRRGRGEMAPVLARDLPCSTPNRTGLPDQVKAGIESISGFDMSDVRVYYNSSKPAQLHALAYTQGTDIHVAPGQERHLPHEAWHVVQQKQGRVQPRFQLKGEQINDDQGLEHEAEEMGVQALRKPRPDQVAMSPAAQTLTERQPEGKPMKVSSLRGDAIAASREKEPLKFLSTFYTGHKGTVSQITGDIVQMKKVIKGEKDYEKKGKMKIDFEERTMGSSAGMYGTVAFIPDKNNGAFAREIDLVQIASMTSNNEGQAIVDKVDPNTVEPDEERQTDGNWQVKDMWRVDKKFHIDLLGNESTPRRSLKDPRISEAYNSERRGKWADSLDRVTMSNNEKVLNQYNVLAPTPIPDTTTRTICQYPGFNNVKGDARETELFDFPQSKDPVIASFHTTVDADRKPWGTVLWGFKSVKDRSDDSMNVQSVQGPEFLESQTQEMEAARRNFNNIMANPSSWTSPEAYEEVSDLLKSKTKYVEGQEKLIAMGKALEMTIEKILENDSDEKVLRKFVEPHWKMVNKVLNEMSLEKMTREALYIRLDGLYYWVAEKYFK